LALLKRSFRFVNDEKRSEKEKIDFEWGDPKV